MLYPSEVTNVVVLFGVPIWFYLRFISSLEDIFFELNLLTVFGIFDPQKFLYWAKRVVNSILREPFYGRHPFLLLFSKTPVGIIIDTIT